MFNNTIVIQKGASRYIFTVYENKYKVEQYTYIANSNRALLVNALFVPKNTTLYTNLMHEGYRRFMNSSDASWSATYPEDNTDDYEFVGYYIKKKQKGALHIF